LSHARDKLNIPSFSFLSELKIYHLPFFIITQTVENLNTYMYNTQMLLKIMFEYKVLLSKLMYLPESQSIAAKHDELEETHSKARHDTFLDTKAFCLSKT